MYQGQGSRCRRQGPHAHRWTLLPGVDRYAAQVRNRVHNRLRHRSWAYPLRRKSPTRLYGFNSSPFWISDCLRQYDVAVQTLVTDNEAGIVNVIRFCRGCRHTCRVTETPISPPPQAKPPPQHPQGLLSPIHPPIFSLQARRALFGYIPIQRHFFYQ